MGRVFEPAPIESHKRSKSKKEQPVFSSLSSQYSEEEIEEIHQRALDEAWGYYGQDN